MKSMPRTYLYFSIFVALLAVGLMTAWRSLGTGIAIAALISLGVGAVTSFWRLREFHRGAIVSHFPNRVASLPEKWHKAFLGE
jgi:hypothetical protein